MDEISINKLSDDLLNELKDNANKYRLKISKNTLGTTIIDAGIKAQGSLEAGLKISEICMGGLGSISINSCNFSDLISWNITVSASQPVLSCLASQYAGWSLSHNDFFSLGSGPARALAKREKIFDELGYSDKYSKTSIVLETNKIPPNEIIEKISKDCKVDKDKITIILAPTTSMVGNLQVVARVLEVALHKAHELKFPLNKIVDGIGSAPIPPIAKDTLTGMGRTNDSIIYGGNIFLTINGSSDEAKKLAKELPSQNSKDFGIPFKEIFQKYQGDFYKIDGSLFSPARVSINSLESGETFHGGIIKTNLVEKSFFK